MPSAVPAHCAQRFVDWRKTMKTGSFVSAVLLFSALTLAGCAGPPPPKHPAYLHALTDLRDARWNLEHRPGDTATYENEDIAVTEIDRAISEIKRAAFDDGKNLSAHPPEDARLDRAGRLHHAAELLRKARADVDREEDNPQARDLKFRALEHITLAIQATERAIAHAEQRR
jgi:hypothetical protein